MPRTATKSGLFATALAASLLCLVAFSSSAFASVLGQGPDNPVLLTNNTPYAATLFDYAPAGAPPGFVIGSYYLAADVGAGQTLIVDLAVAPSVSNGQALLLRDGVNPVYSQPHNGIQRLTFAPPAAGRYSVRIMASNVGTFTVLPRLVTGSMTPAISGVLPADGSTVYSTTPTLTVLTSGGLDPLTAKFTVNGVASGDIPVVAGSASYVPPAIVGSSANVTATVTDGSTTLTRSWKVTIGDPAQPVITAVAPLPGSRVTANTPTLSVFTSYGAATSTVSFVVNGTDISGEVPVVDGVATYTAAPVVGSTVDVTATVTNNGRTAVRAWSFRIGPDPVKPVVTRTPSGNKTYTRRRGSVKYTLAAKVTGPAGGVSGTTVYLQSRTSTKKSWKNTYKLRTNGSGVASKAFRSTKRSTTYYRWVVVADQVVQGYTGPQQKIVVR